MHDKILAKDLPSPLALAYVGDAYYSLYIRKKLVSAGFEKSGKLNELSKAYVTCEAQSMLMQRILPHLSEDEYNVYKRAFNSQHLSKPKRASVIDYRHATGFEALCGMLCLIGDEERFLYLVEKIGNDDNLENEVKTND
jgi:ribonuclease-3 family protein